MDTQTSRVLLSQINDRLTTITSEENKLAKEKFKLKIQLKTNFYNCKGCHKYFVKEDLHQVTEAEIDACETDPNDSCDNGLYEGELYCKKCIEIYK